TRASEAAPATVLRPQAWWRQPLPAWAQVAAAILIFAAGLAIGRQQPGDAGLQAARVLEPDVTLTPPAGVQAQPVITRDDLALLDERLRAIESASERTTRAAAP